MGGQNLSREWLDFAHMDLSSAEFLLGMHPLPVEIICYRSCQKFSKQICLWDLAQSIGIIFIIQIAEAI